MFRSSGMGQKRRTLPPAVGLHGTEENLGFELDDFVAVPVDDPEHQALAVVVGSDDGLAAEEHGGGRAGESGEEQTRGKGLIHEAHERFDGHDEIGGQAVGADLAVPDGREGLNAEEERLAEPPAEHVRSGPLQRVGPARHIGHGEDQIENQVERAHQAQETEPGRRQQLVIRRKTLDPSQAGPNDIEGAVTIEQALPALAADHRSETQIAIPGLFVGGAARREGTWLE